VAFFGFPTSSKLPKDFAMYDPSQFKAPRSFASRCAYKIPQAVETSHGIPSHYTLVVYLLEGLFFALCFNSFSIGKVVTEAFCNV
jgi:hypothetical protein